MRMCVEQNLVGRDESAVLESVVREASEDERETTRTRMRIRRTREAPTAVQIEALRNAMLPEMAMLPPGGRRLEATLPPAVACRRLQNRRM